MLSYSSAMCGEEDVLMAKVLDCGKVNPASGCGHVLRADTEEELLKMAAQHAKEGHSLEPTPELVAAVKAQIRDE